LTSIWIPDPDLGDGHRINDAVPPRTNHPGAPPGDVKITSAQ